MPAPCAEIRLRPFQPRDQSAARALILAGLGDHFDRIDETRNPDIDDIMGNYVSRGHVFLVATIGDALVGTGALIDEGQGVGRMVRLSVCRQHRRKGIARAIVGGLVVLARRRGLRRLEVETSNDWHEAIRLYTECGFAQYHRDDVSVYLAMDCTE